MIKAEKFRPNLPSGEEGTGQSLKHLQGFKISATDGDIGHVHDFFFDDESWRVRYLVADTGHWLPGRKVLLPAPLLIRPDLPAHTFAVALTREQIKTSPDVDTDMPVSRAREIELQAHYDWPFHWGCVDGWLGPVPPVPPIEPHLPPVAENTGNAHLRSIREMTGYKVEAMDGHVGVLDDFITDDKTWVLHSLIVVTSDELSQRKVAVSPADFIHEISWSEQCVKLKATLEDIRKLPDYNVVEGGLAGP